MSLRGKKFSPLRLICCLMFTSSVIGVNTDDRLSYSEAKTTARMKRPVIGILSQVLHRKLVDSPQFHIVSSYIKWIETAGAQVIPILLDQDDSYYEKVFSLTNGLLLPGGDNPLDPNKDTLMMLAAKKLYKLAVTANDRGDYYPVWGTCLGLELLTVLTSNKNVLAKCEANDVALAVRFVDRGRMFAPYSYAGLVPDFSKIIMDSMSTKNLTYNSHHCCLTDDGLSKAGLTDFYRPLAYSEDINGLQFIAIFEAINYPFYGVQFHPEKPAFEFVLKQSQKQIPHSRESIAVSRFLSDFFVVSAIKNNHQGNNKELEDLLIYAYNATYTAPMYDIYEQRYLFPVKTKHSTKE